jgi:hypothetical protein
MRRGDIRKLMGGYAAGTLTEEERRELFAAALEDQELFDELMREEPLRELLADPASRFELRQALEKPASGLRLWWWALPASAGLAAAAFALLMIHPVPQPEPVRLAQARPPAPAVVEAPAPPPAPRAKTASKSQPGQAPGAARPPAAEEAPPERREAKVAAPSARDAAMSAVPAGPLAFADQASPAGTPPRAVAPPAAAALRVGPERGAPGARAAFYAIAEDTRSVIPDAAAPRLGLRYTRDAGVLTLEPNLPARVRVLDGEREIFNSAVGARARATIAAPEGRSLRVTVEREDAAPPASTSARGALAGRRLSATIEREDAATFVSTQPASEHDPEERATYVVAEPGAASMTVRVP